MFIVIIGIIITAIIIKNQQQPYGKEVVIENFDQHIKNLPSDRKSSISAYLYDTIKINTTETITPTEIGKAFIRNNSSSQMYDSENKVFNGTFIVDISKIKQSYKIEYVYSEDKNSIFLGGYEVLVLCLPEERLIYGSFDCKELFGDSQGIDPIVTLLPYSTLSYEIRFIDNGKEKPGLLIKLFISEADRNIDEAAAISRYQQQALDWIISEGFNPDNYIITYSS